MKKIGMRLFRIVGGASALLLTMSQPGYTQLAGGEVHGSIFALVRGQDTFPKEAVFAGRYIFLPDITVYLKNVTTNATSPTVQTNLDGTFAIPSQPEAQYQLCWKAAGYVAGCSATSFILRNFNTN